MTKTFGLNVWQNLSSSEILEQAEAIAQQEDWSLLTQRLQQVLSNLVNPDEALTSATDQQELPSEALWNKALGLALEALSEGEFQERWDIAKLFPGFGKRAIVPLIYLLQNEDEDPELRWFAARILGTFHEPEVLTALIDLLKASDSKDLTDIAANALVEFGAAAIAPIADLLTNQQTRLLAVRALAQIRHAETIPLLLQTATDPQAAVRAVAIEALGSFQDERVTPALIRALTDAAAAVRQAAVTGLGFRLERQADLPLVELIQPLLLDADLEVCQQAAIALSRLDDAAAAAALFHVLKSAQTPEPLRIGIIRALSWMKAPSALEYLQQSLNLELPRSQSLAVLQETVAVLGRLELSSDDKRQIAQTLISLLQSNHPVIQAATTRQLLALTLGKLESLVALQPLTELLADADEGVRLHAIAALKQLDAQIAYQFLEDLSQESDLSPELRQGIAIALREWGRGEEGIRKDEG